MRARTDVKQVAVARGQGKGGHGHCRQHGLTSDKAIYETLRGYESNAATMKGQTDVKSGRPIQNRP